MCSGSERLLARTALERGHPNPACRRPAVVLSPVFLTGSRAPVASCRFLRRPGVIPCMITTTGPWPGRLAGAATSQGRIVEVILSNPPGLQRGRRTFRGRHRDAGVR